MVEEIGFPLYSVSRALWDSAVDKSCGDLHLIGGGLPQVGQAPMPDGPEREKIMGYIDGFVLAAATADKEKFLDHARRIDAMFLEFGATRVVESWGDDVPDGKQTDFKRAVQAKDNETVVFAWIEWPDKATRDAAMAKMRTDPRMMAEPMPFDGKRMIFGGFIPVVTLDGR